MTGRKRRRYDDRPEWQPRCTICGWAGSHSNVCPLGPMPTGRRRDR